MRTWRRPLRISTPIQNLGMACGCTGILTCVLFPVFTTSGHDHRSSCLSLVKQLELGLLMYSQDFDDRLPRAAEWMDATYPYIKNEATYRCPELKPRTSTDFGYAFNSLFATRAISDIKEPAKAILLYDSNDLRWNANAPGRTGVAIPPRHFGSDTFGFADGHAKMIQLLQKQDPESE